MLAYSFEKRAFRHHLVTFSFLKRKPSCSQIIGNHEELHGHIPSGVEGVQRLVKRVIHFILHLTDFSDRFF
jgi:hypothetical protein